MLEGYFDESGIHDDATVCIVAGFYGTQAAWRKVEREWNKVLDDHPEVRPYGFHAKKFFARTPRGNRVGAYADWTDEKADKFLDRLIQVILRNRIFPIGYGVVVADFKNLSLEQRRYYTGANFRVNGTYHSGGNPNKPYYVPFQFAVLDSAKMSGASSVNKIHYFAGIDRTFYGYAADLYKFILRDARLPDRIRDLLGQLSAPQAKDTPGLQAADLLSYELYQL